MNTLQIAVIAGYFLSIIGLFLVNEVVVQIYEKHKWENLNAK